MLGERLDWRLGIAILATPLLVGWGGEQEPESKATWRDDATNLELVRKLNRAHRLMPFSWEFEGVVDEPPLELEWTVGRDLPLAWKGGVACPIGDEIVLTGGLWMPGRLNRTLAYHPGKGTYRELPPPPIRPQYTQGACDDQALYAVGGRGSGSRVLKFSQDSSGSWKWTDLPPLPPEEGEGRWVGAVGIDSGKWLILVGGSPTGTSYENRIRPQLADYRLRLDRSDAGWERTSPYPGGPRGALHSAMLGGRLYVFGGSHTVPEMRSAHVELSKKYGLRTPYNGVPNRRDSYSYDPQTDTWKSLRNLPFPVFGGHSVVARDRYILLMGSADYPTFRVGKSKSNPGVEIKGGASSSRWRGYGDRVLCYDVDRDEYSSLGVMPYGVATTPWVMVGSKVYGFGGEPAHGYNLNTETVLQIGTLIWR